MPRRKPQTNWPVLIDRRTEDSRRRRVIGLTVLTAIVAGGLTAAMVGFTLYTINSTPDGYSVLDICWANDGADDAEGEPLVSVSCSDEHDYVSGATVDNADDCPQDAEGYVEDGADVVCLEPPRNAAGQDQKDNAEGADG